VLLAIVLNLVLAVVLVSGWAFTVWAVYKRLGDPHAGQSARPVPGAFAHPHGRRPPTVPSVKRAASQHARPRCNSGGRRTGVRMTTLGR